MSRILTTILVCGFAIVLTNRVEGQSKTGAAKKLPPNSSAKNFTAEQIAKTYLPSVVLIVCDNGKGKVSQGSGFFIQTNEPGMILSNYHVVEGMVRGKVKLAAGGSRAKEWWIKRLLYVDVKNDLALLSMYEAEPIDVSRIDFSKPMTGNPARLEALPDLSGAAVVVGEKTPAGLRLSASDGFTVGQTIYVLSNPEGLRGTISKGIISGGLRKIGDLELLQIDAPISAGSSGGAVLNIRGDIVGIATGSLEAGQNLNFAVPASRVRLFLREYDTKRSTASFQAASSVSNSWSARVSEVLGSTGIKPESNAGRSVGKTKPISEMTYAELVADLVSSLKNSSFRISEKSLQSVSSISFSGCSMTLSKSWVLNGEIIKNSYGVDLRRVRSFGGTTFSNDINMSIDLSFEKPIVEQSEYGYFDAPTEAAFVKEISIPTRSSDSEVVKVVLKFKRLAATCDENRSPAEPTLKATADWLTERVEGTSFVSDTITYRYQKIRITGCDLELVRSASSSGVTTVETSLPSLRSLKKVEATKNTSGIWGVWLGFGNNFNVMRETRGYTGTPSYEYIKEDKIVIFFDAHEKAKRVGSAFARALELCGEETKEPF